MGAFAKSIKEFAKNTLKRTDNECRMIALTLFSNILDYTPQQSNGAQYSKGWLVNNWRFGVAEWNKSAATKFNSKVTNPLGQERVEARLLNMLKKQGIFYKDNYVTMINQSEYANRAENIGWPMTENPTDTWHYWSGRVRAYHMVERGFLSMPSKYK